jgi:hypothetical protein
MPLRPLSAFVHELRATLLTLPPVPASIFVEAAVGLAARQYGPEDPILRPEIVNVAALALCMRDHLVVHEIRQPVPDVVADTDLHSLPDEPPTLLRGPWICDVRDPERETLFGTTMALGGYEHAGRICLIGLGDDGSARVGWWTPRWAGGEIDEGTVHATLGELGEAHVEWTREAARFAVVLGLLIDAAGTPLRWTDEGPRLAQRVKGERRPSRPWAIRRVYLDGGAERTSRSGRESTPVSMDGRVAAERQVSGHLKRQPCGPGGRDREWRYIRAHLARRWVAPQSRVVVGTRA